MTTRAYPEHDRLLPRRKARAPRLGFIAFSVIALSLLAAVHYLYLKRATMFADTAGLAVAGLAGAVIVLLYLHLSYRRALAALHRGVLGAQEGALEPVAIGRTADDFLQRLGTDYNLLMVNLGSMFREIEECQNRTIAERNRNDAILHSLSGALVCVDSDSRITLSNRQAEALLRTPRDGLIGQSLFDVLDLDEDGVGLLRDAFLYERQVVNKEIVLRLSNETRYFTLNLSLFKSPDPNEIGAAIVLQDVTDYKRLQESVYNTEKLAAIGQLAAGVAHELNTPLGNIMGYARLIQEAKQGGSKLESYTRIISTEAKRCSRIVENLLSYAHRDRCRPETCSINKIIRDVVETVACCQGRRYNVTIDTELAEGEPEVQGGTGQMEIVLVNLLMNAVQAANGAAEGSRVVIRTRVEPRGPAVMEVEDNGPGVPSDIQGRIFDPFFTTKEVGEGTGLGLAISQATIAKLGGSLKYDASFKKGARFIVKLPVVKLPLV